MDPKSINCITAHLDIKVWFYIVSGQYRCRYFMNRIKVINEPSELVSVFRAVDTDLKREIFKDISIEWSTVN